MIVKRRVMTGAIAVLGASLWLLWNAEHEFTSVRAPWTGLTLAASVGAFVTVGCVGRGPWTVLASACAAGFAVLVVDPLIWRSEPLPAGVPESCDPGCIGLGAAIVIAGVAAAVLATMGVITRRAAQVIRRRSATAA